MDRRNFLKALAAAGVSVALFPQLETASAEEINAAVTTATQQWDIFNVNEFGTLSCPQPLKLPETRRELGYYYYDDDLDAYDSNEISALGGELEERIQDLYANALIEAAKARRNGEKLTGAPWSAFAHHLAEIGEQHKGWEEEDDADDNHAAAYSLDEDTIRDDVADYWPDWVDDASGKERAALDAEINAWLDEEPDWDEEEIPPDDRPYNYFDKLDQKVLEALGLSFCYGSLASNFQGVTLDIPPEEANRIAEANGWKMRFVFQEC